MFVRKGIAATAAASSRSNLFATIRRSDQSIALSSRIACFSSSLPKLASQAPDPAVRVPRPIPLDIGNGPVAAASSSATATGPSRGNFRGSSSGSVFSRFGEPIITVIVYSTAATLAVHLLYHHLALEEYRITSNKQIADLEAEIAAIKTSQHQPSYTVQHPLGGRGEFV